jgi:hypothetical protein
MGSRLERLPVDVEDLRVARAGAVLEHVLPPPVPRARDAHVIGDDVEQVAHPMRAEGVDEAAVVLIGADLRVERRRVGDVIAVRAAWHGLQVRRAVAVGNPQCREVRYERCGVEEREAGVELEAVRRCRYAPPLLGCVGRERLAGDARVLDWRIAHGQHAGPPGCSIIVPHADTAGHVEWCLLKHVPCRDRVSRRPSARVWRYYCWGVRLPSSRLRQGR